MTVRLRLAGPASAPLYQRIEHGVRDAVEAGQLRPGDRLPSVADLARELGVARLTVLKAFRGLEREGLLASHVGRGTFVAGGAAPESGAEAAPDDGGAAAHARALRRLREGYARDLDSLLRVPRPPGTIDLTGGVPSPASVPDGLLARLLASATAQDPQRLYGYGGPAGLLDLRTAIAARLAADGAAVTADGIVVTMGSQQAASLVAAWAREEARPVLCETPTFTGMPGAFELFGNPVASVPWGEDGLDLDALEASPARRPLLYVCPDFHNPTGLTMSVEARRALARFAVERDALVVEDVVFRDLRYEGEPPPLLYGMLPPGRRVLIGSVSKSFMTGLRVGFLAADASLVADLLPFKRTMDLGGPTFVHAMAAAFLADGYDEHLARMRRAYREGRDAMLAALAASMPAGTRWTRPQGGFQLWLTLPEGLSAVEVFLRGVERGVATRPGPAHDIDGRYGDHLRVGWGGADPASIATGVARLADATASLLRRGAGDAVAASPV